MESPCKKYDCKLKDEDKNNPICEKCQLRLECAGLKTEMPIDAKFMGLNDWEKIKNSRRAPKPIISINTMNIGFNSKLMESIPFRTVDIENKGDSIKFTFKDHGDFNLHGDGYFSVNTTRVVRTLKGFPRGKYSAILNGNTVEIRQYINGA